MMADLFIDQQEKQKKTEQRGRRMNASFTAICLVFSQETGTASLAIFKRLRIKMRNPPFFNDVNPYRWYCRPSR